MTTGEVGGDNQIGEGSPTRLKGIYGGGGADQYPYQKKTTTSYRSHKASPVRNGD